MHHPMQIYQTRWSSAFCWDAEQARGTRRQMLEHAAGADSLVYPQHFAGPHVCRVGEKGGAFTFMAGRG
jgi:hypothetical protein